jgi:hypothetical protein
LVNANLEQDGFDVGDLALFTARREWTHTL